MKKILSTISLLLSVFQILAGNADTLEQEATKELIEYVAKLDSFNKTITFQTGEIKIKDYAKLVVPKGYKYIPKEKSDIIVYDIWGNQKTDETQGMIVKEDWNLANFDNWAFIITYDESGYIKDDEADDIDYKEMENDLKKSVDEGNEERKKNGYDIQKFLGWASTPFYDKQNKILHWAKSFQFGESTDTVLNYDIRILGRKGFLSMNAVGDISQLSEIKSHIPDIIHIAKFEKGNTYFDFDENTDKIAAYSIGGLLGAKVLAKAGILALILKNIKLIAIAIFGFASAFGKKIKNLFSKNKEEYSTN